MRRAGYALAILVVVGVAGWLALPNFKAGGVGHPAPDASAKTNARNLVSQVEACFTDSRDYRQCQSPAAFTNSGLMFGSDAGEVTVHAHTAHSYTAAAHSKSGATFYITSVNHRRIWRWCEPGREGEGACGTLREW